MEESHTERRRRGRNFGFLKIFGSGNEGETSIRTTCRSVAVKLRRTKGKGGLISPGAWYQLEETPWKGIGRGKRKRQQEGGFAFGPYTQGLSGIEKKRRPSQKGEDFVRYLIGNVIKDNMFVNN